MALQYTAEFLLVGRAGGFFGGRGAPVALAADFQFRGTRLAQPLHGEAQNAVFNLRFQHPADYFALR
jgi:hypothetical protein